MQRLPVTPGMAASVPASPYEKPFSYYFPPFAKGFAIHQQVSQLKALVVFLSLIIFTPD